MSQEADIKNILDGVNALRSDGKAAIDEIFKWVGRIADAFSIIGIPEMLLSTFKDFFSGPDPTQQYLDKIYSLLQVTFSFEQAEADFTQMHLVNDEVVNCRSSLQALLEETLPYKSSSLDAAQTGTLTATNQLESEPYWQRVYFDQLRYSDYWFGRVSPPADDFSSPRPDRKFVFDYRLTLLGYLNAISVRTATLLLLLKSNFIQKQAMVDEIRNRALELEKYLNRILAGFVSAPVPTQQQITYSLSNSEWDLGPAAVVSDSEGTLPVPAGRAIGVVQAHDGAGIVDTYPPELFPNPRLGPFPTPSDPNHFEATPPDVFDFQARYALGVRRRSKNLYADIGLPNAWQAIQDLRRAIGEPFETLNPMLYWSFHDVYADLGKAEQGPPQPESPNISLKHTAHRLATIGKVDTSQSFLISWRTVLEAAAV